MSRSGIRRYGIHSDNYTFVSGKENDRCRRSQFPKARLVAESTETLDQIVETIAAADHGFDLAEACMPAVMLVGPQLGAGSGPNLTFRLTGERKTMAIPIVAMTALDEGQDGPAVECAGAIALL